MSKKQLSIKPIHLLAIMLLSMGALGVLVELTVTTFVGAFQLLQSNSFLSFKWMIVFPSTNIFAILIYMWAGIPYLLLDDRLPKLIPNKIWKFKKLGILVRAIIYGLLFMCIEYICGAVNLYIFGLRGWDYRSLPLNIDGLVTFTYLPFWMLLGFLGDWIYDRIIEIEKFFFGKSIEDV